VAAAESRNLRKPVRKQLEMHSAATNQEDSKQPDGKKKKRGSADEVEGAEDSKARRKSSNADKASSSKAGSKASKTGATAKREILFPRSCFQDYCAQHNVAGDVDLLALAVGFHELIESEEACMSSKIQEEQKQMQKIRATLSQVYSKLPEYYDVAVGDWIIVEWKSHNDLVAWYRGCVVGMEDNVHKVIYEDGQFVSENVLLRHVRLIRSPGEPITPPDPNPGARNAAKPVTRNAAKPSTVAAEQAGRPAGK
jgi:hypothetical protein